MSNQYEFLTRWRVEGACGEVADVLADPLELPRWRPSRNLSFLLKPVFEANHRWAMQEGERSLTLELARRRATSDAARANIPPPPGPVTFAGAALVGGAVAVGAGIAYLMLRSRRRPD